MAPPEPVEVGACCKRPLSAYEEPCKPLAEGAASGLNVAAALPLPGMALPHSRGNLACVCSSPPCRSGSEPLLAPATPAGTDSADAAADSDSGSDAASRFAYITLITRDFYLPGVQALARSLAAVQARHPLVVMHTPDTLSAAAAAALRREGVQLAAVQRFLPPGPHNFAAYKLECFVECWTKLRMWELGQYDRLVYLDADMLVLRNIDALFALPPGFYAAPDCAAGRATPAERAACPLFCPERPSYFNAGMFVMRPCAAELARFGALLAAGAVPIGRFAEQDFLNHVYAGAWRPLPPTFNAQKGMRRHHPGLWRRHWGDVAVLHYTDAKPWQRDHPEHQQDADLVELWWRVFEGRLQPGPAAARAAALPLPPAPQ